MNERTNFTVGRLVRIIAIFIVMAPFLFWHPDTLRALNTYPQGSYIAKDFAIIRKGATWHIFGIYCYYDPQTYQRDPNCQTPYQGLRHLTSTNLKNWTEVGWVVPPGSSGSWDDGQIWAPSIVENNGTYYMFYAGTNDAGGGDQKIGLATSTDLYTWTKYSGNPVVDCSQSQYTNPAQGGKLRYHAGTSDAQCRDPNVSWDSANSRWVMTFTAVSSADGTSAPFISQPAVIAEATSTDLHAWTFVDEIPATYTYTTTESSHVFEHNGTFYMGLTDNGNSCSSGCIPPWSNGYYTDSLRQSLVLFTSSNRYSGWGPADYKHRVAMPDVLAYAFASEYIQDRASEYMVVIDIGYNIKKMQWNGASFHLTDPTFGGVSGRVVNDTDGDGTQGPDEPGVSGVTVDLRLSSYPDGRFVPNGDDIAATTTTDSNGNYSFTNVLPDTYYISIEPSNFGSGAPLEGMEGTSVQQVSVTGGSTSTGHTLPMKPMLTSWNLLTGGAYQLSSGAVISGGRVTVGNSHAAVETVQPTSSIPFATATDFRASDVANGGSVRFIVSNDGGSTWNYWNGSQWTASNETIGQSNTAVEVATYITSFPDGGRQFLWRALLSAPSGTSPVLLGVSLSSNREPSVPVRLAPTSGTVFASGLPTFSVQTTDPEVNAVAYELQIDRASSFSSASLQTFDQATSQAGWSGVDPTTGMREFLSDSYAGFTVPKRLSSGTWYWRVRSTDPDGSGKWSAYSASGTFTVPDVISQSTLTARPVGTSSAIVSWTSSLPTVGTVEYGTTSHYGHTAGDAAATTSHDIVMTGLSPNTPYHFTTRSLDEFGRTIRTADYTIMIPATVISGITVSPQSTAAVVTWLTNEPATSGLRIGRSVAYGTSVDGIGYTTRHAITVTKLVPKTTYHVRVQSSGSTDDISSDITFTTAPTQAPVINSVRADRSARTVTVRGTAAAGHTVSILIDGTRAGTKKISGTTGTKNFSVTVTTALLSRTRHTCTLVATDPLGNRSSRTTKTFIVR